MVAEVGRLGPLGTVLKKIEKTWFIVKHEKLYETGTSYYGEEPKRNTENGNGRSGEKHRKKKEGKTSGGFTVKRRAPKFWVNIRRRCV